MMGRLHDTVYKIIDNLGIRPQTQPLRFPFPLNTSWRRIKISKTIQHINGSSGREQIDGKKAKEAPTEFPSQFLASRFLLSDVIPFAFISKKVAAPLLSGTLQNVTHSQIA